MFVLPLTELAVVFIIWLVAYGRKYVIPFHAFVVLSSFKTGKWAVKDVNQAALATATDIEHALKRNQLENAVVSIIVLIISVAFLLSRGAPFWEFALAGLIVAYCCYHFNHELYEIFKIIYCRTHRDNLEQCYTFLTKDWQNYDRQNDRPID